MPRTLSRLLFFLLSHSWLSLSHCRSQLSCPRDHAGDLQHLRRRSTSRSALPCRDPVTPRPSSTEPCSRRLLPSSRRTHPPSRSNTIAGQARPNNQCTATQHRDPGPSAPPRPSTLRPSTTVAYKVPL